jgi:hypothetical protein
MATSVPNKTIKLHSLVMSLADVEKIFRRLQKAVKEQAKVELGTVTHLENETDEQLAKRKEWLNDNVFRVTVTINGADGTALHDDDVSIFTSPERPDRISSIFMGNNAAYQSALGRRPFNRFLLLLDFSTPPLVDHQNLVSSPTPNDSHLEVTGDRTEWVANVSAAVTEVTKDRRTKRAWIHRAFVYDIGLALLAVPLGIYACWKASDLIATHLSIHPVVTAAVYVYVFVMAVWAYRILFGYAKWAFPTMELTDNRNKPLKHRVALSGIIIGLVVNAIYDFIA